jgi:hypothetical protein
MRHRGAFGGLVWPVLLPIVLSAYIPFTLLSVGAMLTMIIYAYRGLNLEEKLDIEKWGSDYQQYMKRSPKKRARLVISRAFSAFPLIHFKQTPNLSETAAASSPQTKHFPNAVSRRLQVAVSPRWRRLSALFLGRFGLRRFFR